VADNRHNTLVRREFGANSTGFLGCAQIIAPDKLNLLTVDPTSIIDLLSPYEARSPVKGEATPILILPAMAPLVIPNTRAKPRAMLINRNVFLLFMIFSPLVKCYCSRIL
jgi:hypothetical protein